ncbi:brevican core protein isoform X1 [Hyperolius riggenbachi]|uniref:brevican core protein isoform X1 n=1 Tax=Hyperolius riggenbachi TaxID=752182 RepID=UPI0035A26C0E
MTINLLVLVFAAALTSPVITTEVKENSKDHKNLQVRIGHSPVKAVLSGTLTIPCHITYHQSPPEEVTAGRRAVLSTPRVKWTFISNEKEVEILVAQGHKVKINEGYRLRASLPNYTTSEYDVSLVLNELISNDSGVYKCRVQHGIEDDYDMLEVKVKGVVFLYREGISRYAYTFPMAQAACAKINALIATPDQLLAAYHGGYEQCDAGWVADQTVRYPIQTPREGCYGDMDGFPGVRNYGVLDPDDLFDVYCYVEDLNGEVILGSSPNKFTFTEAKDHCSTMGVEIASTGQLYAAWNEGVDHCNPGWLSDGSVRYPIVAPREKCGGNLSGVKTVFQFRNQTGFPDPQTKYDVYCFRGKDLIPTQNHTESHPPLIERVQNVITVTESFEELKLPEVKAENEAQGFVDTIPLNDSKTTRTADFDVEDVPTVKNLQEMPLQPTVPVAESLDGEEDLSPAFASFPPYEEHADDSEESTIDSTTIAISRLPYGDNPGLIPEFTRGPFDEQVLPTSGDSILDVSFVNVLAENDYDNMTDSTQEPGVTVSESASHISSAGTPDPAQFSEAGHTVDVHSQDETSQENTNTMTLVGSISQIVPTTATTVVDSDTDDSGVTIPLLRVNVENEPLNSLDITVTKPIPTRHPKTQQDDFEASGHEDHLLLTGVQQTPKTLLSSLEELVSGDRVSETPDPTKLSHIFETNLVVTTPVAYSEGPQSFNSPNLSWEEGSGETPDSTWTNLGGNSIANISYIQTPEANESEYQGRLRNIENATQSKYEDDETSTAPASHLLKSNVYPGPSTVKDFGVDPHVHKKIPFPTTSIIGTEENHLDLDSIHISSTVQPNTHGKSTSPSLEKTLSPTESYLSHTDPLPAVPTEKAIVGSSVNFSDACYPNPCQNGGTCIEEDDDDVHCLCLPGYFGKVCEINAEKCPDEWDSFQGFCYKHFYTRKSWEEAETHCRDYGGHLVSIVTPEEQEFVNNQYKDYQWTGLNDRTIEGDFQWSDGNPVLFENWNSGQPDSYFLSGEDCVVTGWHDGGQWSDVPCNYHLPYTCKLALVTCGPAPEVASASTYGRPKTRYQINSVVGYRCDSGLIQRNSPIIRCQADGVWEEPQISCIPSSQ